MYPYFGIKFCTLATMPLMAIFCYNEYKEDHIFTDNVSSFAL